MPPRFLAFLGLAFIAAEAFAQQENLPAPLRDTIELRTLKQQASYTIGVNIGTSFRRDSVELDLEVLVKGLADGLAGARPLLSEAEMRQCVADFQKAVYDRAAQLNKQQGEAFLAANKDKPGVTTLPSGLQYQVIKAGDGPSPRATDAVKTHYRGTLIDGTEFDISHGGEPAEFGVNGVIPGWTEALQRMKVGDQWRLFVPSELAYGESGKGPIGPNAVLIFEIELLSIE